MSHSTAREIIERAMANRSVYDAMAARESEVWGRILPALEHSEARVEDGRASAELRVSRHQASLTQVAKEKGLRFKRGVTLGCGAGRLERVSSRAVSARVSTVSISREKAIADARETAKLEGLSITYEVGDLNFLELPPKKFDLVVAQTSLHHVLFLEHVAEQAWRTLKDGGYL